MHSVSNISCEPIKYNINQLLKISYQSYMQIVLFYKVPQMKFPAFICWNAPKYRVFKRKKVKTAKTQRPVYYVFIASRPEIMVVWSFSFCRWLIFFFWLVVCLFEMKLVFRPFPSFRCVNSWNSGLYELVTAVRLGNQAWGRWWGLREPAENLWTGFLWQKSSFLFLRKKPEGPYSLEIGFRALTIF